MSLRIKSIALPTIAKAYRNAFKAGHGGKNSELKQFLSRFLFYICERTNLGAGSPLEITIVSRGKDVTLKLNPRNRQYNTLYFAKYKDGYETLVARSIEHFLPDDGIFLDAGSNWGYFPLLVASNEQFHGKVHAFEPMTETFRDLREVVEQAGISDWVETYQIALGNEIGVTKMIKTRHSGLAHISQTGKGLEVKLSTIDDCGWDRLDVMKVDVEGHELAVFRGAETTLDVCNPVIVFENGTTQDEASLDPLKFLESKGYHFLSPDLTDGKLDFQPFTLEDRHAQPSYMNIVALPEGRTHA
ncbi:MAG: FkbM family methyltransferase [Limisphaerales bacterium]|jgi:FkbM family methyltransferase